MNFKDIKSYTGVEQSKRLAEFLPIKSADMSYSAITDGMRDKMTIKAWEVTIGLDIAIKNNLFSYRNGYMIPCWSLAALFNVLPIKDGCLTPAIVKTPTEEYCVVYTGIGKDLNAYLVCNNPIDACYEAIINLHEHKLL